MADVLIVGASIAGSVAAWTLARQGVRSIVLERRPVPGDKVCGEGLQPAGRLVLDHVIGGIDSMGSPIEGFRFEMPESRDVDWTFPGDEHGVGVHRFELDRVLRQRLDAEPNVDVRAGCSLQTLERRPTGWLANGGDVAVPARFVIGADGIRSRVRDLAGWSRGTSQGRWGVRARLRGVDEVPRRVEIRFTGTSEIYTTPLGGGELSVAVLSDEEHVRPLADSDRFLALLAQHGLGCGGALTEPPRRLPHRGRSTRAVAGGDLFLAGDAAHFLDPISGAGMTLAALTGSLAAGTILRRLEGLPEAAAARCFRRESRALVRPYARLTAFLRACSTSALVRRSASPLLRAAPWWIDRLAHPTLAQSVDRRLIPGASSPEQREVCAGSPVDEA